MDIINPVVFFWKRVFCALSILAFCLGSIPELQAQQEPDGEALLTFSHPSIGQYYVNAVFFGDVAFLPLGEFLSLTEIPYEQTDNKLGLQGVYPSPKEIWKIDPVAGFIWINGVSEPLPADKFYLGELDLFVHPEYFQRIFGMEFTVNPYALSLSLKSEQALPIEEKMKREAIRKKLMARGEHQGDVPMAFPRDRSILGLGMMDYAVNFDQSSGNTVTTFQLRAGGEFLGGDIQGAYTGSVDAEGLSSQFSGLRWRYVLPGGLKPNKNVLLSSITLGQINTTSLTDAVSLTGFSLTNNPVIPRQELDVYVIDGYTERDSEVELLIGGQLVDFMRADEVGYYRFNAPVTYGTVRLTLRIYTPQGEVIIQDRQLQIPFSFLPKGFLAYNIQGGRLQNAADSLPSDLVGHADLAFGLSKSTTIRAGVNYGDYFGISRQNTSFGLSTRLFQQYLFNVDYLPERYYRANASVFYANNINISAQATEYLTLPDEENASSQPIRDANLNAFLPFKLFGRFSGIRFGGEKQWLMDGYKGNLQADFNMQLGKLAARFNYRAQLFGQGSGDDLSSEFAPGVLTGSFTYSLPRSPSLPVFVKGMFIRSQVRYNTASSQLSNLNIQVSQTLFKLGRLSMAYDRDLVNGNGQFQIGFLYDFNFFRSSSQFSKRKGDYSVRQSISGSIGIDPVAGALLPSNRDQVSRSGVSVRMFIDENENGKFDKGEEIVPAKAVRLDKSGNMLLGSDGVLRITQLQSYWTYTLEIDTQSLPDPTLAPKEKKFGFVAEPNRFKVIDIPLYRTGIIEGAVLMKQKSGEQGIGGLRLLLTKKGTGELIETLRTFADGSYYAFGLLPGNYQLEIDPKQLEFLNANVDQSIIEFEIKPLIDGDYLENLNFTLSKIEEE
ncbi:hypothetical protein [uncultured Algoriphagus sp.]|uniref:hypothetical protein n=1 Tax=uncultured Algoriphagus sp. TaxID=417365 RepID=UPI00258F6EBB|nr:hypothetical protein [uncultured Algoriphagus sp.]